jgi:hypothetical protein
VKGYVYVAVGVAIVAIGIFLIYQLESPREEQMPNSFIPKLSQYQAFQFAKSDLLKHAPNISKIFTYDVNSSVPIFDKSPISLVYENSDGIQATIKDTDYSIIWKCDTKITSCFISNKAMIELMKDKLTYSIGIDVYLNHKQYFQIDYLVDASDGKIVWSDLYDKLLLLNYTGVKYPSLYQD